MFEKPLVGLLWRTGATESITSHKCLWRSKQWPTPAVFVSMLIDRIYKVLGNDETRHLQTSYVAVELTAHLRTVKATGSTQFTGNETTLFTKCCKDNVIDGPFCWHRIFAATIVTEVWPPLTTDEPRLLVKELAIHTSAIRHDRPFPLPQRPIPTAIRKQHIATVIRHHILCRKPLYATIQQRQKSYLLYECCQLCRWIYLVVFHLSLSILNYQLSIS